MGYNIITLPVTIIFFICGSGLLCYAIQLNKKYPTEHIFLNSCLTFILWILAGVVYPFYYWTSNANIEWFLTLSTFFICIFTPIIIFLILYYQYRFVVKKNPEIKIVGVEHTKGHSIQGLKNMGESITPKIYQPEVLDEKIIVKDNEAFEIARYLATKEGLLVGMSSGASVAAALRVAKEMVYGVIVAILPDRGDRYLSSTLFRSICAKCPP